MGGMAKSFVKEHYCCIRSRLGEIGPEQQDIWWNILPCNELVAELHDRLENHALPFLAKFESRDKILNEWRDESEIVSAGSYPLRIVLAIIQATRGNMIESRRLLSAQCHEADVPGHAECVKELAARLGVGALDLATREC
jgi:hypothetical protein